MHPTPGGIIIINDFNDASDYKGEDDELQCSSWN